MLRVEASDDLSGVDKIYVCGNSFSKLNHGTLDIRLKDYADNYEQITIQALSLIHIYRLYSKSVLCDDINYAEASDDEKAVLFELYCKLVNLLRD